MKKQYNQKWLFKDPRICLEVFIFALTLTLVQYFKSLFVYWCVVHSVFVAWPEIHTQQDIC